MQLLGALIQELAGDVARKNARLLIVLAGEFSALYVAQTKGFDAVGIPYVDATTGALAQEMSEAANAIYFSYNQHWTVAAHRAVANLVHRKILQLYTQGS